jgi:excisionase family DNA binding protein
MTPATLSPGTTRLLTPREAADYLGVKVQTLAVWRMTKRHPIPYVKVGVSVRYRLSDLDAWPSTRTVAADARPSKKG